MDTVYQLERACADAWPSVVDRPLGQWRLRAAGGFTGRANSALTLGDPGRPLTAALAAARAFAAEHDIPATAHVVVGADVESGLVDAGWVIDEHHTGGAESAMLTGRLADLAGGVPAGTTVPERVTADWWPLAVGAAAPTPAQRHVLCGGSPVGFGTAREPDGRVVGVVRGAVVGDLLHVARLAVDPAHRRRGTATGLLAALAAWGTRHGARRYALQVATHNRGALSLYAGLGARRHHHYRYWIPGPGH